MIEFRHMPVAIVALLCAYAFARTKLNEAAQPKRIELADRGEALLASPHLNETVKAHVRFCLRRAFGASRSLIIQIMFVPAVAAMALFSMGVIKRVLSSNKINDKATRADAREFFDLYDEITWLNNPILMLVFSVVFHTFITTACLVRILLIKSAPALAIDKWIVDPLAKEAFGRFTHHQKDSLFVS
jgi:hypothetical protein